ncbi:hypothetical protein JW933_08455, partial [candidate division FCPU426 bacterium]|nr:hypothetical protein [candidate division FCPU426 bacterium]
MKHIFRIGLTLVFWFLPGLLFSTELAPYLSINKVIAHMRAWLEDKAEGEKVWVGGEIIAAAPAARAFYQQRYYEPAWCNLKGPLPEAKKLLVVLESMSENGLEPNDYHVRRIRKILDGVEAHLYQSSGLLHPVRMASLDIYLTDAFLLCAAHLAYGRVDLAAVDEQRDEQSRPDILALLAQSLESGDFAGSLHGLATDSPEYLSLQKVLVQYL